MTVLTKKYQEQQVIKYSENKNSVMKKGGDFQAPKSSVLVLQIKMGEKGQGP